MDKIIITEQWIIDILTGISESGMGYVVCSIMLNNGDFHENATFITNGEPHYLINIEGYDEIPFAEEDIYSLTIKKGSV